MIGDVVRLIAAWLGDATYGVGAQLALVPRDGGDSLPTTPTIIEETTDARLGRGRLPETGFPYLAVTAEPVTAIDQDVNTDDGYFRGSVRIDYVEKDVDADTAKQDGNYVLRAAVWSIRQLMRRDVGHAGRLRNQIALTRIGPVTVDGWQEQLESALTSGGFTVQLEARDYYSL